MKQWIEQSCASGPTWMGAAGDGGLDHPSHVLGIDDPLFDYDSDGKEVYDRDCEA